MQDQKCDIGISSRVKELRLALKLTQGDFAKKLKIEQAAVSKIENRNKQLDTRIMQALAEIFQININWILTGIGEKFIQDQINPPLDPDPEVASLLTMAKKVLTSDNPVAFDALERNIKYFAHTVDEEIELNQLKIDVIEIKKEIAELRSEKERRKAGGKAQSSAEKAA